MARIQKELIQIIFLFEFHHVKEERFLDKKKARYFIVKMNAETHTYVIVRFTLSDKISGPFFFPFRAHNSEQNLNRTSMTARLPCSL